MPAPLILVEASPRRTSDGAIVLVRLAGGGGQRPYRYGGEHWRAGIAGLPTAISKLSFDGAQLGSGGVPEALEIVWAPARNADLAELAALYWTDAAIIVRIGVEGSSLPPVDTQGLVLDAKVQGGQLRIALADLGADLKRPLLVDRFAGTGGVEGPVEWQGQPKSRAWGRCYNVPGRPTSGNIWIFGDPSRRWEAIDAVRDMGVPAGATTLLAWQGSIAATFSALDAAAAPAGGGILCPSIAAVKWWTQPGGDLRVDIRGENAGGYVETAPAIAQRLVAARATTPFASGAVSAAATARPGAFGWRCDSESVTIAAALTEILGDVSLSWVLDDGQIAFRRWDWLASARSARSQAVTRRRLLKPVSVRRLGYRRNQAPMARGDLAGIVLARDVLFDDGTNVVDLAAQIDGFGSDSVLSKGDEKREAVIRWQALHDQYDSLNARYGQLGSPANITAARDGAAAALTALDNYLTSLSPSWSDATTNTPIAASDWRNRWTAAYQKVGDFAGAIAGRPGTPFPMVARGAGYIDGNKVGKSAAGAADWSGADVYSAQSFRGGAFMSYRPVVVGNGVFGALTTDPQADQSYLSFTASWHCSGDGSCAAYVGGNAVKGAGPYTASTSLVLTYDGGRFRWYKDGAEVFSREAPPDLVLFFDSAFYEPGASIKDVAFGPMPAAAGGTLNLIPLTQQTRVQGGSVATISDSGWGNAGAASREAYTGGCSTTFTFPAQHGDNWMAGLAQTGFSSDASFSPITFALHRNPDNNFYAFINGGQYQGTVNLGGAVGVGKVEFDGRYVRWYVNNVVYWTYDWMGTIHDPNAPENKLFFRCALASAQPRLDDIVFVPRGTAGKNGVDGLPGDKGADGKTWYPYFAYANSPDGNTDFTTGEPEGRAYVGTATGTSPTEPGIPGLYNWSAYKGPPFGLATRGTAVVAGDQLIKASGVENWDSDAFSTVSYRSGAVASFQFSAGAFAMAGLNTDPTADASYSSLDYAWYGDPDGLLRVYESGTDRGQVGTYDANTKLQVQYDGRYVRYFKDGVLARGPLDVGADKLFYFDSSLARVGGRITNIGFAANGTLGANGVSPLSVSASPSSFQVACDYNGVPKAGTLPIVVNLPAKIGGTPVALSALTLTTSGCSASVNTDSGNPTGFTVTAMTGDATIAWSAQSGGQSVSGTVTGGRVLDGPPATSAKQNFSNLSGFNVTSYPANGPSVSMTIPNSGSVTAFGYLSYRGGAGHTKRGKLQYRVNGGTWTDIPGSEVNGTETEQTTEDTVPPRTISLAGDLQSAPDALTGLPVGGTIDARMVAFTTNNGSQGNTTNNGYLQLTGN